MVKIIDIMKKLNPDEVDCLKKEFQEKNKIISELEYKLSEKFKNCYWCEKSDELIRLQEKYEYLEGWHDAVLEESSEYESKIADLEAKLAESEKLNKGYLSLIDNYIFQLNEKDKLLRQKINKMKSTEFIRMCVSCGFMVQAKEIDNQTAIAELEKVKEFIKGAVGVHEITFKEVIKEIDQQIKELKGDADGN